MKKKIISFTAVVLFSLVFLGMAERAEEVSAQTGQGTHWLCVATSSTPGQPARSCVEQFNGVPADELCPPGEEPHLSGCSYEGLQCSLPSGGFGQWCKCIYSCTKIKTAKIKTVENKK